MEGLHMIRDLVRQGDWVAKLDLKDSYFLIPVHPCHQKFFQFTWKVSLYHFQCLLLCPPQVFTKVMKPVVAFLRERGIKLIIYLDDLLIISSCPEILSAQINLIRNLFLILGLVIDEISAKMTISLPQEKIRKSSRMHFICCRSP